MTGPELSATQRLAGARKLARDMVSDIDNAAASLTDNEEISFLNYAIQHAQETTAVLEAVKKRKVQ